jgi:restriction system protein
MTTASSMPTWEGFMVPILQVLSDGQQRSTRDMFSAVVDHVGLPQDQREEILASGQTRSYNRIGWALSDLARAEAITRPRRGQYVLTDSGRSLLAANSDGLTEKHLRQIPAYQAYVPPVRTQPGGAADLTQETDTELDPVEQIEQGVQRVHADVAAQLLKRLREQYPDFLEQSVLDVLVAMGYGGAEQRARRIGGTGDGGVDGVIDQDPLGLERIYVQAKRYAADNTVGRETIQAFVGALHGNNASRGVFITTSRFSPGAREYAAGINSRVILIDGERLAGLMIKYGIGIQTTHTYAVVELDEDYFE